MKVDIYNIKGQKTTTKADLNPAIFEVEASKDLMHQVMVSSLSNRRKVSASTKTRSEVRGGGKKPWRQKGTGRARAGTIRSPLWRGGGITFGPSLEKNFKKEIPKKMNKKAILAALSSKKDKMIVLDKIEFEKPSTKKMVEVLSSLPVEGKILVVYPDVNENLRKSVANISGAKPLSLKNLNLIDLLNCDTIVITKDSLKNLEDTYAK